MSEQGHKRKRSKGWYRKQAFLNKRAKTGHRLTAGQRGFIVTCNEHEKDAVKEAYNILNEYADKLYGPEECQAKEAADSSDEESDDEDIEKAIANEVQSLKNIAESERRFQNCHTGARNCLFIKTTITDPTHLAHAIFTDLLMTKVQKSRHALRLLPVVGTCKGNLKSITALAEEVLGPFFTDTKFEVTYTIMFKARNNNGIGREMTISTLRQIITEKFPAVLTRYTSLNPQLTILVEVMCGVGCIAVVKDFARFRKYNLIEVVSEKTTTETVTDTCKGKSDLHHREELDTSDTEAGTQSVEVSRNSSINDAAEQTNAAEGDSVQMSVQNRSESEDVALQSESANIDITVSVKHENTVMRAEGECATADNMTVSTQKAVTDTELRAQSEGENKVVTDSERKEDDNAGLAPPAMDDNTGLIVNEPDVENGAESWKVKVIDNE